MKLVKIISVVLAFVIMLVPMQAFAAESVPDNLVLYGSENSAPKIMETDPAKVPAISPHNSLNIRMVGTISYPAFIYNGAIYYDPDVYIENYTYSQWDNHIFITDFTVDTWVTETIYYKVNGYGYWQNSFNEMTDMPNSAGYYSYWDYFQLPKKVGESFWMWGSHSLGGHVKVTCYNT